mmetsp:Transcript_110556/g.312753  ORF Transcript_110556/g.312753 Transcript_110556/m.312753 type:complete len:207 (+) Transcript_110556:333-953(+)
MTSIVNRVGVCILGNLGAAAWALGAHHVLHLDVVPPAPPPRAGRARAVGRPLGAYRRDDAAVRRPARRPFQGADGARAQPLEPREGTPEEAAPVRVGNAARRGVVVEVVAPGARVVQPDGGITQRVAARREDDCAVLGRDRAPLPIDRAGPRLRVELLASPGSRCLIDQLVPPRQVVVRQLWVDALPNLLARQPLGRLVLPVTVLG